MKSSLSNKVLFNFQTPGPQGVSVNCIDNVTLEWSLSLHGVISHSRTEVSSWLLIKNQSNLDMVLLGFNLYHVNLSVSGCLTLQISLKSPSSINWEMTLCTLSWDGFLFLESIAGSKTKLKSPPIIVLAAG